MRQRYRGAGVIALAILLGHPPCLLGQHPTPASAGQFPDVHVTDARLSHGLDRLLAGSALARAVMADLKASGLPVVIGTPAGVAALSERHGGPTSGERLALLSGANGDRGPIAWVAFRVGDEEVVERAWVVIDVEAMAAQVAATRLERPESLLSQDVLAALAHEFVAHVGSVARTRRLTDFCDDPTPASQAIDPMGCSVRVENQVRRELNRALGLRGADRLPERSSYSLDVMNFARAQR